MLEGYEAFANTGGYNRGRLYNVSAGLVVLTQAVDGVGYTFATVAISFGCLYFGEFVGATLPRVGRKRHESISSKQAVSERPDASCTLLDYSTILSAALAYLVTLLLYFFGPSAWRHRALFPMLLSPPGAMLRYALSSLNARRPFLDRFPLGTFIVNIAGTLVIGGVYAAQHVSPAVSVDAVRCTALYALQQGFCGCLTTVSTFIVECRAIRGKRWTWIYAGMSVILGHLAVLVTFGAVGWARGSGGLGGEVCTGTG